MGRINKKAEGRNQELVLEYLEANASDVLVEKINEGKRTMADCWKYITDKARNKAKGNSVAIEDAEVFGWAVHFFEESSGDLQRETTEEAAEASRRRDEESIRRQKERAEEAARKQKEREAAERKLAEEAEAARKQKEKEKAEAEARKAAEAEEKRKQKEFEKTGAVKGQTSLFDLFGMEA